MKAKSIRLFGINDPKSFAAERANPSPLPYSRVFDRTFALGDVVEYDSYNFAYHGKIVAIGAGGSVSVAKEIGSKKTVLALDSFVWRNWDLDLAQAAERNREVSMSI